jgi:hypothetical protein
MSPTARTLNALAWLFLAATIIVEIVAAVSFRGTLWGVHHYAFASPVAAIAAAVLAAAVLAIGARPDGTWPLPFRSWPGSVVARFAPAIVTLLALALFWAFRSRTVLLGDGIPIVFGHVPTFAVHPREPLSGPVHAVLFHALGMMTVDAAAPLYRTIWDSVALGSCIAGAAFVWVAWLLSRELTAPDDASAAPPRGVRWLACAVLLTQGFMQLAFGYVENYAFPLLAVALFLLASIRAIRGAAPLGAVLGTAALMLAFQLSLAVLLPSIIWVIGVALRRPETRMPALRDLAIAVAVAAVGGWALARAGIHPIAELRGIAAGGLGRWDALVSTAHVRDFANEHLLIGPVGLLLFVPLLALVRRHMRPQVVFLLAAALPAAFVCWMLPDLSLGYARDWDIVAPLGPVFTSASLALMLPALGGAAPRALSLLVAASIVHTTPWIAVNASPTRSLNRFAALPLDLGRAESTIAHWFYYEGDREQAKRWLARSLDAYPSNNRAAALFGQIALEEGRPDRAAVAYRAAVLSRPRLALYRRRLVEALVLARRLDPARIEAEELVKLDPTDARSITLLALVHVAADDSIGTRTLVDRAVARMPDAPRLRDLEGRLAVWPLARVDSLSWWAWAMERAP